MVDFKGKDQLGVDFCSKISSRKLFQMRLQKMPTIDFKSISNDKNSLIKGTF